MPRSPSLHLPPAQLGQHLIAGDETGELQRLLACYCEEMTVVGVPNVDEAVREVQERPACAVLLNAPTPQELWPLVERASLDVRDTPIIGCALNARAPKAFGAGVTAHITKPVTRAKLAASVEAIGRPVQKVLVVDDGPDDREVFASLLRAIRDDLEVATAASGEEALEALRRLSPDLVLLDILMPDMDGWQVLELKAQDARIRDVPVILVSAQDLAEQPLRSRLVMATMGNGLSASALLACAQQLPALLVTQ